jgi:uncharacterized protein (DUF1499 family)
MKHSNEVPFQFRLVLVLALFLGSCSTGAMLKDRFAACPDKPNCVSSRAPANDQQHFIAPIAVVGEPAKFFVTLQQVLAQMPRTTLITQDGDYLHYEVRSALFRFVDDVEFLLDQNANLVHVRSASRTGYSDLGVNKKRVLQITQAVREKN